MTTQREHQIAWALFTIAAAGIDYLTFQAGAFVLRATGVL